MSRRDGGRRCRQSRAAAVLGLALVAGSGFVPGPAAGQAAGSDWSVTVAADAFAEGRPVPVHGFFRGYSGRLGRGSDAVLRSSGEVTLSRGAFSVGYVQRYDYEIRASRDAAVLYYRIANDLPVAQDAPYRVAIDAYANRRDGVQVGYTMAGADWSLTPRLSVYRGLDLIDGRLDGTATAAADDVFSYDASVDYLYRKDVLFERDTRAPRGAGFGFDLIGSWSPTPRLGIEVALQDVAAWLWWRNLPGTKAEATSATADRDADGRLTVRPTLSGREFFRRYAQRIHPEFRLAVGWRLDAQTRIEAAGRFTEVKPFGAVAVRRQVMPWLSLRVEALPWQRALGIGIEAGPLALFVMSDALDYRRANVLSLRLGIQQRF